jgi:hypothetical protein
MANLSPGAPAPGCSQLAGLLLAWPCGSSLHLHTPFPEQAKVLPPLLPPGSWVWAPLRPRSHRLLPQVEPQATIAEIKNLFTKTRESTAAMLPLLSLTPLGRGPNLVLAPSEAAQSCRGGRLPWE